jgi:hypothetical protein
MLYIWLIVTDVLDVVVHGQPNILHKPLVSLVMGNEKVKRLSITHSWLVVTDVFRRFSTRPAHYSAQATGQPGQGRLQGEGATRCDSLESLCW